MDFFKPSDVNFFKERLSTNRKYRKSIGQDVHDGNRIKAEIFNKTNHWAKSVAEKLNGDFEVIEDNRWNISGFLKEYSWARLFKKNLGDNRIYYTLGIHGDTGKLCYKIDCQRDGSNKLGAQQVEQFDKKLKESNITWQEIDPANLEKYDWESLAAETAEFIRKTSPVFDELNTIISSKQIITSNQEQPSTNYLNQILYGPPGTGKTYQSKSKAVEIIDGSTPVTREKVNARYAELYEKGQIKFITFHQSTTYEDFVEGIKPVMAEEEEENGNVQYRIEDGIFKRMCIQAAYEFIQLQNQNQASSKTLVFSQLFDQLVDEFGEKIGEEGKGVPIPLKSGNEILVTGISPNGNFLLQHFDGQTTYTVSKSRAERLYNEIEDFKSISNINTYFRNIIGGSNSSAYWAILNQIYEISQKTKPVEKQTVDFEVKKRAFERINWTNIDPKTAVPKYVLIIDEINRGNIAAILGELITLLEEDKRGGQEESLDVTLPYSKSKFSVPPNLYIIGTMNTADRSVEALDTALRRRFSFQEIAPRPELLSEYNIEGIMLQPLLTTINRRIRKLLDKDHMIGHADFIKLSKTDASLDDLRNIFHNKLLPLLQEYFYGNFGKIQLVLGKAFIYDEEKDPVKDEKEKREPLRFAENDGDIEEEYSEKSVYLVRDVFAMKPEEFTKALIKIYHPE